MNADIVSSKKRETVRIANWTYLYIPMTAKEKKQFAPDVDSPCWRIAIKEPKNTVITINAIDSKSFEEKLMRDVGLRGALKRMGKR
jgi:hypothetical protein